MMALWTKWWRQQLCRYGRHRLHLIGYVQAPVIGWGRVDFCTYCPYSSVQAASRREAEDAILREPTLDLTARTSGQAGEGVAP